MIYWAQLFHFYQPPTQLPSVLEKICNESYRPLLEVFSQYPHTKATVNINGVVTEMLKDCGHGNIIDGLKELADKDQIELPGGKAIANDALLIEQVKVRIRATG